MHILKHLSSFLIAAQVWQVVLSIFPMHITDFSCHPNPDYCSNVVCQFDTIRTRIQVLSFNVNVLKPLNDIQFQFQLNKKAVGQSYTPLGSAITENLCKYLNATERADILGRLVPSMHHYSLILERCPLKGIFSIHNYPLDLSFYPSIPLGSYNLDIQVKEAILKSHILNASISFEMQR